MAKEEAADGTTPAGAPRFSVARQFLLGEFERKLKQESERQDERKRERARGRTSALDEEKRDKGVELEERQHKGLRRKRQADALVQEQLADRRDE